MMHACEAVYRLHACEAVYRLQHLESRATVAIDMGAMAR